VTSGWRQTHSKGDFDSVYNRGEQDFYNTPVFNAKLEYEITKNQKATFLSGYSKGEGGYAASPGDPSIDRVDDWRQTLFQGQYFNTALGHTDFSVKAGVYKVDQQNFKPYTAGTPEKYKVHGKRYHVETNVLTRIVPQHTLIGGFVHQHTEADSAGVVNHLGSPTESRHHEYDLMGYFLQDEYKLTDYLSLINSARYDMYDDIDDQFTMRNTAMWYINKKNTLRFSVGNAYRRNDIYDMYYYVDLGGPYFHGGGPKLEQQRVRNYELEYRTQLIPNHTVKVGLFKSKYKNFTYATGFPEITISSSGNKYTIRGFTLEIDGEPVKDKFKWYANYTYYDAKDVTNHIRMEDVPRFMFNAGVQYFPIKNLYLSTDLHYQDGCEDVVLAASDGINGIPSNTEIPAFTTVDAKIGYFPKENIELSISVENLFNDKHYEYPGHSERGRTLYAGVRIVW
jgi:outer membrane receptor protein involved in Fe transport